MVSFEFNDTIYHHGVSDKYTVEDVQVHADLAWAEGHLRMTPESYFTSSLDHTLLNGRLQYIEARTHELQWLLRGITSGPELSLRMDRILSAISPQASRLRLENHFEVPQDCAVFVSACRLLGQIEESIGTMPISIPAPSDRPLDWIYYLGYVTGYIASFFTTNMRCPTDTHYVNVLPPQLTTDLQGKQIETRLLNWVHHLGRHPAWSTVPAYRLPPTRHQLAIPDQLQTTSDTEIDTCMEIDTEAHTDTGPGDDNDGKKLGEEYMKIYQQNLDELKTQRHELGKSM